MLELSKQQHLISDKCRLPDHCMLTVGIELSMLIRENLSFKNLGSKEHHWKKIYRKMGDNYMSSQLAVRTIPQMLEELEHSCKSQKELDDVYTRLVDLIISEAESSLGEKNKKRKSTKFKEYWCSELSAKWKLMHESERVYRLYKKQRKLPTTCQEAKSIFRRHQADFDKCLKKKKREYFAGLTLNIEACNTKNPQAFWRYVNKLGPRKLNKIPMQVLVGDKVCENKEIMLDTWKKSFESIYQANQTNFNDDFKEHYIQMSKNNSTHVGENLDLNRLVSHKEVKNAVNQSKLNKAVGVDCVSNELLKNDQIVDLLLELFNNCLTKGQIPNAWRLAIINPIPKEKKSETDPLKYRGLSL